MNVSGFALSPQSSQQQIRALCAMPFLVYARCPFWYMRDALFGICANAREMSEMKTKLKLSPCSALRNMACLLSSIMTSFALAPTKWRHRSARMLCRSTKRPIVRHAAQPFILRPARALMSGSRGRQPTLHSYAGQRRLICSHAGLPTTGMQPFRVRTCHHG